MGEHLGNSQGENCTAQGDKTAREGLMRSLLEQNACVKEIKMKSTGSEEPGIMQPQNNRAMQESCVSNGLKNEQKNWK